MIGGLHALKSDPVFDWNQADWEDWSHACTIYFKMNLTVLLKIESNFHPNHNSSVLLVRALLFTDFWCHLIYKRFLHKICFYVVVVGLLASFTIIICYVVWSVLYLCFYVCCYIFPSLSVCLSVCLLVCLPACLLVFHFFSPKTPCPHLSVTRVYMYTYTYLIKGHWRVCMHTLISSAALSHTVLTQCCEFYSLAILCKLSSSQRICLW